VQIPKTFVRKAKIKVERAVRDLEEQKAVAVAKKARQVF